MKIRNKILITLMLIFAGFFLAACPEKGKTSSTEPTVEPVSAETAQAEVDALLKEIDDL